jgi:hypothetical protein
MIYLVFDTQPQAIATQQKVSENLNFAGETIAWAVPLQRAVDDKWVFPKPDLSGMVGVTGVVEEIFANNWLPFVMDDI